MFLRNLLCARETEPQVSSLHSDFAIDLRPSSLLHITLASALQISLEPAAMGSGSARRISELMSLPKELFVCFPVRTEPYLLSISRMFRPFVDAGGPGD